MAFGQKKEPEYPHITRKEDNLPATNPGYIDSAILNELRLHSIRAAKTNELLERIADALDRLAPPQGETR